MNADVAIIGGGFAGLTAALYLGRARRPVVVFDDGLPRNRFAGHAHGFLGQDGRAPAQIGAAGRADLAAYPAVTLHEARVTAVTGSEGAFVAEAGPLRATARQVILATGMRDILPDLPGLADCWGITANQCPYCHGFELADRPTAILMTQGAALHQTRLLRDWTDDLTLLTNGHPLPDADREDLARRGVRLRDGVVRALDHHDGQVTAALLDDGRLPVTALYLATRAEPAGTLAADLGCRLEEGPFGPFVAVDSLQRTSVPGVLAAGDLCRPAYGAVFAAADGARAATAAHAALVFGAALPGMPPPPPAPR
jgi:thioredoxin reductase (NADPH)